MTRIFRVCREIHARLDGEGARRVGGRWNSPGLPVVYMAESVSLAVLENLVHMSREDFPAGYVVVGAVIPTTVRILSLDTLGGDYRNLLTTEVGDKWVNAEQSAGLRVPSFVVPNEFVYLLNPGHTQFAEIVPEIPKPFIFDSRLFR